jgi:hypothetical protein
LTNDEFKQTDYGKLKINICCTGSDSLPLDSIEEFQGKLKKRSKKDIEKIIRSIVEYGFSFPFFIWQGEGHNYCLDGHGRILALAEMRKLGTDLPCFPVSYIEAENEEQAKQKLLRLNSQYGNMTFDSVVEFADGMEINSDELGLNGIEIINVDDGDLEEEKKEEKTESMDKPYKQVHILLSMSQDDFLENSAEIKNIKKLDGVEYVQSEN